MCLAQQENDNNKHSHAKPHEQGDERNAARCTGDTRMLEKGMSLASVHLLLLSSTLLVSLRAEESAERKFFNVSLISVDMRFGRLLGSCIWHTMR